MRRQPWPAKRAKALEQAVAYLPSLEQSSAFPLAAPLRKVHVLGAVLPHILQSFNKQLLRCPLSSRRMLTSASQNP